MKNTSLTRTISAILLLFLFSCIPESQDAQSIIDKLINLYGGDLYENSTVEFDFRGRHYKFERNNGVFAYHRIFTDSAGRYYDLLDNVGFKRKLNGKEISVDDEWARRYSNSINSVAYFSYLPFGLNDPAVNKNLIGEEEIDGSEYYKIRVTFDKEGGGEDYDDVFVYWINKSNYRMDYFGYSYLSDGGGIRFRKAINMRKINGLVYSDYINYKGPEDFSEVSQLGQLFIEDKLTKLSEITIENLEVRRIN